MKVIISLRAYFFLCKFSNFAQFYREYIDRDKCGGSSKNERGDWLKKDNTEKYGHEPYSLCVEPNVFKKIDIYGQVILNFDAFVDYVWSHKGGNKRGAIK